MKAAKQARNVVPKSVFCIDNFDLSCNADELMHYVEEMSVRVISCYPVKSRHRRSDVEGVETNRQAFRLCIVSDDCNRLLDAEKWPKHIVISEWFFKPTVVANSEVRGTLASMRAASAVASRDEALNSAAQQHKEVQCIADDVTPTINTQTEEDTSIANRSEIGSMNSTDDMEVTVITQDPSEKNNNCENVGPQYNGGN